MADDIANATNLEARFWAKVDKSGEHWLWIGGVSHGYGIMYIEPRCSRRAHVIAFYLREGRWPKQGLEVRHDCGIPLCVKHVYESTHKRNMEDMIRHGTTNPWQRANKTCPLGHPYTGRDYEGFRSCNICRGVQARKSQNKKRLSLGKEPKGESCAGCAYLVHRCHCAELRLGRFAGSRTG